MRTGKADLHIHTRVSDGMATVEDTVSYAEHETGLDVIAIVDHEDVTGGLQGREFAARKQFRLEVLPGVEITTLHGHLLILGVEENPPAFRSIEHTLEWAHAHDGLAVIPHPMSRLTRSLSRRTIDRICARGERGITFDAIELESPSPAGKSTRGAAAMHNVRWRLPVTGGSDAHHLAHIGTGWTLFPGSTANDLCRALRTGNVSGERTRYPSIRTLGAGQVLAGLAWGYTATPRKMIRRLAAGRNG